jgi:hypothetical protein
MKLTEAQLATLREMASYNLKSPPHRITEAGRQALQQTPGA